MEKIKVVQYEKEIEYSMEELTELIIDFRILKRRKENNFHLKIQGKEIYLCEDDCLPGEVFREHLLNKKIEASNYGRIKYDGKIVKQKETDGKIGWLQLEKAISYEYEIGKYYTYSYVYQIVCDIWHGFNPYKKMGDSVFWERHHISNDGYDNRPENLLWISRVDHKKIPYELDYLIFDYSLEENRYGV